MSTTESENKQRLKEYIKAWNTHDIDALVAFFGDKVELSAGSLRKIPQKWFRAFPDLRHEIQEIAADDDWVLARLTLRGTHEGEFDGIPPSGEPIEIDDHLSVRFDEDGQIVELNATADLAALKDQIGVAYDANQPEQKTNEALVRQYFGALNDRNKVAFKETMSEEFTYGDIEGPEEMAEMDWKWLEAMDLTWHIEGIHAGEDFVATRLRATGTHRGKILGLEPTGNSFEVSVLTLSLIEDGKIVEWFGEWDFAGLLNQIGAIDSPVYHD